MLLSVVEDENIYLNYWDKKDQSMQSRSLNNVCAKMKAAMALEISEDDKTVFIGGCNTMDIFEGRAVLSAVHLNQYMVHIASLELHDKSLKNIFQVKRMPKTNVLVVSGFKSISIVQYCDSRKSFTELKQLKNLHSGEIFDFVINGREIYSICSRDEYVHKF